MVGDDGGLHRVLLLLARHERLAAALACRGPTNLDLCGVESQRDALGLGISEHVFQRAQPHTTPARDGESPLREQSTDFTDCPGDGGAVHLIQQGQHRVRKVVTQMDERGYQPVHEHQLKAGTRPGRPLPGPATHMVPAPLNFDDPRPGQLRDQGGQMSCRDAREQHMRQHRTVHHVLHQQSMPTG